MIFNLLMGGFGLILAGEAFGRGLRGKNIPVVALGVMETIVGAYFIIVAIGYNA